VEENTARGDRHGNREAEKPKKLKPKENRAHFDARFDSEEGA
jgi:hypothetical protein